MTRSILSKFSLVSLVLALSLPVGCGSSSDSDGGGGGGGGGSATGSLVATFGDLAFVLDNQTSSTFSVNDVVLANSGTEVFLVGTEGTGGSLTGRIEKRSLSTGALITSFDTDGIITTSFNETTEYNAAVIDATHIYIVGSDDFDVTGSSIDKEWRVEKRRQDTGALETAFSGDGIYQKNWSVGTGQNDQINDIVRNATGPNLILAGEDSGQWRMLILSPENAAEGAGSISDPSANSEAAISVNLSLGDLWVLGTDRTNGASLSEWRIEKRSSTSLILDVNWPSAASGGFIVTAFGLGDNVPVDIESDSLSLYLLGSKFTGTDMAIRIEKREKLDGDPDISFAGIGAIEIDKSGSDDLPYDILRDAVSNALYIVGSDVDSGNLQWRIEKRLTTNGKPFNGTDASPAFDTDGVLEINPSSNTDEAQAIVIDSANIYVAGTDSTHGGTNQRIRMEKRSSSDGAAVTSFGAPGIASSNPSGTVSDSVRSVASDGTYFYTVGDDGQNGGTNLQWRLEKRLLSTGALVSGFPTGSDGIVTNNLSAANDTVYGIAVDSLQAYLVGTQGTGGPTGGTSWMIQKYDLTTGATGFSLTLDTTLDLSSGEDSPYAVAVDSTHIYVVGADASGGGSSSAQWEIQKRSVTDGALDTGFDSDGRVQVDLSTLDDTAYAVVVDGTSIFVAGDKSSNSDGAWVIEKRSTTSGALDGTFGTSGQVTSNPGTGNDAARALAVDSTNGILYVAGHDADAGGTTGGQWRIEAYDTTNGTAVNAFGGAGFVSINPSSGDDKIYAMILDSGSLYLVGSSNEGIDGNWAVAKVTAATGALDTNFGLNGIASTNPGVGEDIGRGVVSDSSGIVVVGEVRLEGLQWRMEKRVK